MSESPFRRGVRFVVPLVAALAAISQAVRYGAMHSSINQSGKVNLLMQHRIDPELAIFGASNALTGLDAPAIEQATGETTFNFSMDGTPFVQYQALVRELAGYSTHCRHVVLAETFMTFIGLPALNNPGKYLPYLGSESIYPVFHEIDPKLAWRAKYVPFYSFIVADQAYYKTSLRGYLALLGRPPENPEHQGYLPQAIDWTPPSPADVAAAAAASADDFHEQPRVVRELTEAVALLNRSGKQVFVVITPLQASCLSGFPGYAAHREKLRSMLGEGVVFLDYTDDPIASDTANFHNCGHLNARGATAFAKLFARDFKARAR